MKKINWAFVTFIVLVVIAVVFWFRITQFMIFPDKLALPLLFILLLVVAMMGFFSLRKSKKTNADGKKKKKVVTPIINVLLCVLLVISMVFVNNLGKKMKGIFSKPTSTEEVTMNVYAMSDAYKQTHSGFNTYGDKISDYRYAKFLSQSSVDQDNVNYAFDQLSEQLGVSLNIEKKDDIWGQLKALYAGEGDAMVLNSIYADSIADVPGYENFNTDTQIIATITRKVEVEATPSPTPEASSYTNSSFMVFVAGSDSRAEGLTQYTRTDVDILLAVDPVNMQILEISMPRDWYVRNPALGNGYDKLTHLGNHGMQNSIDGLNQEYGFDYIKDYVLVNFVTFKNIVDGLGGIEVDNPYEFTGMGTNFPAGTIHLNGDEALNYVRERHALNNGDYGRNEHQAIVIQAIIKKITSPALLSNANSLLDKLQGNFLSSLSPETLYKLMDMQLDKKGTWKMVSYHLGGVGDYNTTASMGSMQLYVSYPIESQIEFAKEQLTKVMNGEVISQESLPDSDRTVYLPN